jgi:pyruvate dehydrogenase E2 component (dihydrolipoamide acetyltransferase)
MSDSVQMPALGESVTEGTVTRWLKQVGERVEVDEPLLEVSTDKVDTEIPSPVAGVVEQILVGEDETVEVGATLAVIGDGAGAGSTDSEPASEAAAEVAPDETPQSSPEPAAAASEPESEQATQPESVPEPAAQAAPAPSGGKRVSMPALGESVTEGTVTRWLKQVGDSVEVDEPLLEVSTDKVDTEIPSPVAGVVQEILVSEDETVPVGADLVVIGAPGSQSAAEPESSPEPEPASPAPEAPAPAAAAPAAQAPAPSTSLPVPTADGDISVYVTPLVRRLATEHGIDLAAVAGTGVGGRVRKQDIIAAAEAKAAASKAEADAKAAAEARAAAPAAAPAPPAGTGGSRAVPPISPLRGTTEKMSRLRKVIAQRMVESLQTSAQLTTVVEVDITRIARLRARAKSAFEQREGVKLSFMPFFALAAIEALKQYPKLNASIDGDSIVYHSSENLGFAVDTDRGLFVPVIRDAGDLNIAGIARKIADLATRTRNSKVTPDELAGGTFTLTNTGSRGALFDTPILFQPQVGILGTGAVVKRPIVIDVDGAETIAIRSMVYLALSYDHRIVDGADAARFLVAMKDRLEDGAFESDLGL